MTNIKDIYNWYLNLKADEFKKNKKKDKGLFSASQAGSCFKKQYYMVNNFPEEPINDNTKAILRLGTIVHKEFEECVIKWKKLSSQVNDTHNVEINEEYQTEYKIDIPKLNVRGHLDIIIIDHKSKLIKIIDLKTINDWSWQFKFNKKKKKKPSTHYYLQVSTYVLGIKEEYPDYIYEMSLLWYNKNNSNMKEQPIDPMWEYEAEMYWSDLNEFIEEDSDIKSIKPFSSPSVPFEEWQCKYCNYHERCTSDSY